MRYIIEGEQVCVPKPICSSTAILIHQPASVSARILNAVAIQELIFIVLIAVDFKREAYSCFILYIDQFGLISI